MKYLLLALPILALLPPAPQTINPLTTDWEFEVYTLATDKFYTSTSKKEENLKVAATSKWDCKKSAVTSDKDGQYGSISCVMFQAVVFFNVHCRTDTEDTNTDKGFICDSGKGNATGMRLRVTCTTHR